MMGYKREQAKAIIRDNGNCNGACNGCPLQERVCYAGECPDDLKVSAAEYWLARHPKKVKFEEGKTYRMDSPSPIEIIIPDKCTEFIPGRVYRSCNTVVVICTSNEGCDDRCFSGILISATAFQGIEENAWLRDMFVPCKITSIETCTE